MSLTAENQEDNILYELVVYSEWSQEQDVINRVNENAYWPWKFITGYWAKYSSGAYHIAAWMNQQLPWLFAVGAEGKAVAILQDTSLEIRTLRDNYAVPIGKAFINKDPCQQWRRMEWSPDGTLLAIAHSNGSVDVYDLLATHLFVISSPRGGSSGAAVRSSSSTAPDNAIAGLAFVDTRTKHAHWSYELLCLDYHGQLNAYFVSPTQGFEPSHSFSFAAQLPYGVTALCADHSRHLLILSSPVASPSSDSGNSEDSQPQGTVGSKYGLTTWRMLDDRPYYAQAPGETGTVSKRWLKFQKVSYGNTAVKLSLSADGSTLAAIHLSGAVSIWSVPSLKCQHFWPLERQRGFDDLSPALLQLPAQRRVRSAAFQNPFKFHPVDINWWSEDSVILARCSGAVSVCAVDDLRNKLGSSAEFFDGSPRISPAFDSTFLGLECDVKVRRKRLQPTTDEASASPVSPEENQDELEELSEDEEKNLLAYRMGRSFLYWMTDSERFQPPRKRPKLLAKTFRLLGFKRTTPEELYIWKLDAEEYGEALALARAYGLDCDLVYQRQWRNAPATVASIHDYLSKVSKRNWLLRECLERVPKDVDAARELLLYGLKNTDLQAVVGGKAEEKWSPLDQLDSEAELLKKEEEKRRKWLAQVDFDNLTVEQKMLITTRRRLLKFLDRLSIYEMILGGPAYAGQRFDPAFFESFRSQSALESTAKFAQKGEWQAVAVMFTFDGSLTLPHRLAVCSSFPETTPPFEYRSVLPECDANGQVFLWEQQSLREADWCECPAAWLAIDVERSLEEEAVEQFYSEETKLKPFRASGVELDTETVSLWYRTRAADIEKQSLLVDNALDLVKLGLERNVPNLDNIHHQLLTLEALVYDLQQEGLDLEKLTAMSDLSISQLIMSRCDGDSFLPTLNRWLMPYLRRLDTLKPGCITNLLRGVLVARSQEDLGWCLQVCTHSKANQASAVVADAGLLISLALDCIYACQRTDQLEVAMKIYDCLPERPTSSKIDPELSSLHDRLDQLQTHLEAADILENYDVPMTPAVIAAKQKDEEQVEQLFVRLTRTFMRKPQPPTENQWKELLQDMLELQRKVFSLITPQLCYEILVGSLLSSAKKESITSAGLMLQLDPQQKPQRHKGNSSSSAGDGGPRRPLEMSVIPFQRSKQLILQAAEEYFNSSENLSDPNLELATYCLGLVTAEDDQIQTEKDLISAVHLLLDYGLDMPPLKIRLSRNRLLLVDQVLKQANKAYKNASRLLRLGHLLRACDSSELEGQIYVRIAETAMTKRDMDVAGQTCNKLRLSNHSSGWKVCARFAGLDEVEDVDLRMDLVSYALVYCPEESMEELLQLRWKLEIQLLRDRCTRQVDSYMTYENGSEDLLSLMDTSVVEAYRQDVAKKREAKHPPSGSSKKPVTIGSNLPHQVLQTTAETTKTLVDAVRNTLKFPKEAHPRRGGSPFVPPVEENRECARWALPVFYWDSWMNGGLQLYESHLGASYRLFSLPESTSSELNLLAWSWRMEILADLLQPYSLVSFRDDTLAKLAECLFPEDCLLALGHLLDLGDAAKAWEPLTRLPSTEVTLQTAAYYFALRILRLSASLTAKDIGSSPPRRLIERCSKLAKEKLTEEQRSYRRLLKRSLRLLGDVSEAQQLRRLDSGVDINRFTTDDNYKRDTIVGLAITADPAVYSAAVRLAAHYGVSDWEVTFSHLTALFAEESIGADRLMSYMEEHRMRDTLFKDPESLGPKLAFVIYPSISGRDHPRLALFFELMTAHPSVEGIMEPKASTYLQVLRKLDSIKGVDVKKLLRSAQDFRREVEGAVNADNVGKLSKVAQLAASSVKDLAVGGINQNTVHSIWARKYFFQLADERRSQGGASSADWFHRFESSKNHVNKLPAEEFLKLVDGLCFSDQSLEILTLDVRSEICRRCLKLAESRAGKSGKDASMDECRSRLQKWCEHLDRLKSDEYSRTRVEVVSSAGSHVWKLFDQSRAEEAALRRLLLRVLVERQPMSVIRLLVGIFPPDFTSTPEDVLMDAIRFILDDLRGTANPEDQLLIKDVKCDPMDALSHLLTQVRAVLDEGETELISQSDVDDMLRHFCDDDSVDMHVRLRMLQTLPADSAGLAQSGSRVQWLQSLALIHQTWSDDEDDGRVSSSVTEDDLSSSERRRALFERLLDASHSGAQLGALGKLLHFWPPFSSESEPPWIVLWKAMTELPSFPGDPLLLDSLRLAMEQKPPLSDQNIRNIYESLVSCQPIPAATRLRLHVALRSSLEPLMDDVIDFLDSTSSLSEEGYDPEILDLILDRGLVGRLARSPLYGPLCDRILSLLPEERPEVEDMARQLVHHGQPFKAGHLLQLTSGLPRYLLNLSSSIYFVRKKL